MNATMMVSKMKTTSVAEPRSGPGARPIRESSVFILIMIDCSSRREKAHCLGKPPTPPEDSRSSTISGMVRVAVSNGAPTPLTLTHGEREQSAAGSVVREVRRADTALGCSESQRRILPLPEGEGWGEGEGDARSANRVGTSPEVC